MGSYERNDKYNRLYKTAYFLLCRNRSIHHFGQASIIFSLLVKSVSLLFFIDEILHWFFNHCHQTCHYININKNNPKPRGLELSVFIW